MEEYIEGIKLLSFGCYDTTWSP